MKLELHFNPLCTYQPCFGLGRTALIPFLSFLPNNYCVMSFRDLVEYTQHNYDVKFDG